jgi:hypothetical protein
MCLWFQRTQGGDRFVILPWASLLCTFGANEKTADRGERK